MSKKKKVVTRDERKTLALATGIKLARKSGVASVTLSSVAKEHKITGPLLFHIFGTTKGFHAALRKAAKKDGVTLLDGNTHTKPAKAKPAPKKAVVKKAPAVVVKVTKPTVAKKAVKAIKAIPVPVVKVVKPKKLKVTVPKVKFAPIPTPQLPLIPGVPGTLGLDE